MKWALLLPCLLVAASCADPKPKQQVWLTDSSAANGPVQMVDDSTPATQPGTRPVRRDLPSTGPSSRFPGRNRQDGREQPGPDNTGVADHKNLKVSQRLTVKDGLVKDGQVIENLFITGGINANGTKDVIIRNCEIDAAGQSYGIQCQNCSNLQIEHCELYGMSSAAVFGDGFTAKWNDLHNSGADGFKPGDNCLVESNWVHEMGYKNPKAHADGVQIRGGHDDRIVGNYFDMANNVPDCRSNSSLIVQSSGNKGVGGRPPANVVFEQNWCRGGNYSVYAEAKNGQPSTLQILNNRFVRGSSRYGCGSIDKGVIWQGNVFDGDGSAAMPQSK